MKTFLGILCLATTSLAADDDKRRVFITDSDSWEMGGGFGLGASGRTGAGVGQVSGGARPQTVEIMKTFRQRCPVVTVTLDKSRADYVVILDHEGGKDLISRDNKIAVFKNDGDLFYSGSTRSLGNAVSDACRAIRQQEDQRTASTR